MSASRLGRVLLGAGALAALACSVDDRMLTVRDGGARAGAIPLVPDARGEITSVDLGLLAAWYLYGDSVGSNPDCGPANGVPAEQCSMVFSPTPYVSNRFGPENPNFASMCTTGLVAKVPIDPTTLAGDYTHVWGVGIGVAFDAPFDAPAHGITGLSFVINTPPLGDLQVAFPTAGTEGMAAYWGGKTDFVSPVLAGKNVIRWANVGGPLYLGGAAPPFDPTALTGFQFFVGAIPERSIPFAFCVSSVDLLTD